MVCFVSGVIVICGFEIHTHSLAAHTPLDGLPEAIAEGKQPSGVYRVYTPSRRGISGLYNI